MTATPLQRSIGAGAHQLHVAGQLVPGDKVGAITIRHGRSDTASRPAPATLSVTVDAGGLTTLPQLGDLVTVQLGPVAIAALGIEDDDVEGTRWRFVGTASGLTARPVGGVNGRAHLTITATSDRSRLGRTYVGDTPWPAEDDGTRARRILSLAGAGLPALDFAPALPPWSELNTSLLATDDAGVTSWRWPVTTAAWVGGSTATFGDLVPGVTYRAVAEVWTGPAALWLRQVNTYDPAAPGRVPAAQRWQAAELIFTATGTSTSLYLVPAAGFRLGRPGFPPMVRVRRITITPYVPGAPQAGPIDPGSVTVLARDVDRQTALQLLDELAEDTGGELADVRNGLIAWHSAEHRRNALPEATLTAGQVLADPEWEQQLAGTVNDVTVVYGAADPRAELRELDQPSIDAFGPYAVKLDTQLVDEAAAAARARQLVGRLSRPVWMLAGLTVDLLRTVPAEVARQLLAVEFGDLLAVTGFPESGPFVTRKVWIEGWTETISARGWRLAFDTSDYAQTGPTARWADIPSTLTWADVPADLTWLASAGFDFGTEDAGRWVDLPADVTWADVPADLTWTDHYAPGS
jgi:hypothetical protein